jgi:hypothetical protein
MERAIAAAAATPSARLRLVAKSYVDFAIAPPVHFCVMFEKIIKHGQYPSLHVSAERTFTALAERRPRLRRRHHTCQIACEHVGDDIHDPRAVIA